MNPEDRNKAVLLVLATVLVLGGSLFMVRSQLSANSPGAPAPSNVVATKTTPPDTVSTTPATTPGATPAVTPGKDGAAPATGATDQVMPPSSAGTNPFKKVISTDPGGTGGPQASTTAAEKSINDMRKKRLDQIQGTSGTSTVSGTLPPATTGTGSLKPLTPDGASDLNKLNGTIVTNGKGTAMVSYNGEMLYLKAGDKFGDGIRVRQVSQGYVVFTKKKKSHRIEIGESLAPLF